MSIVLVKDDKWNAVSHIQKCVRRGLAEEAISMVGPLFTVDHAYLRYRLAVIAVEDVGIANAPLVAKLLEGRLLKRWIDAQGGVTWLEDVVGQLARSPKDRTACDWGAIARYVVPEFEIEHGPWTELPFAQAVDIAFDLTTPLAYRSLAAWRCAGTDLFPTPALPENHKGDWQYWIDANRAHGVSTETLESMTLGQRTQREWHPAFLGMCEYDSKLQGVLLETPSVKSLGYVGDYLSASLDMHTSAGNRALRTWYAATPELQQAFQGVNPKLDRERAVEMLGRMVFLLEGGQVSPKVTYGTASKVLQEVKTRWSIYSGLPGNTSAIVVWRHMPGLHAARQSALLGSTYQSGLQPG